MTAPLAKPGPVASPGHHAVATVATVTTDGRLWPHRAVTGHGAAGQSPLRWVSDPADELRCVHGLLARCDLSRGVIVCLAAPGAPWPVLARDLLLALGKDRHALAGLGRARLAELTQLWMRAEQVRHLVVLRAHLLPAETLSSLEQLAEHLDIAIWLVAHDPQHPRAPAMAWTALIALLDREPTGNSSPTEIYGRTRDLARRAGRTWRLHDQQTMNRVRYVRSTCVLGQLLQNLTIDAHDVDDLRLRLHATQRGLRDEGLQLTLPDLDRPLLRYLGPKFGFDTVARLRRIACPVTTAALTLAFATGNDAPHLALLRRDWTEPAGRHVRAYTGTCRIPPQARPMLRALLIHHDTLADPAPALLVARDGTAMLGRRIAHVVTAGAHLAGLRAGSAGWAREKHYTPETFGTSFTGDCNLRPLPTR